MRSRKESSPSFGLFSVKNANLLATIPCWIFCVWDATPTTTHNATKEQSSSSYPSTFWQSTRTPSTLGWPSTSKATEKTEICFDQVISTGTWRSSAIVGVVVFRWGGRKYGTAAARNHSRGNFRWRVSVVWIEWRWNLLNTELSLRLSFTVCNLLKFRCWN